MSENGQIKNPLVAQEEANTILESVRKKSPSKGCQIDKTAIRALEAHSHDYVLTAQADKTVRREKEARYDDLTGLLNRKGMKEEIEDAMDEVKKKGGILHLVFIDLRKFKKYNDDYGHDKGDQALRELANGLLQHVRPYDKVARWGGEEFVLLLKNRDKNFAQIVSDRLHESLVVLDQPFNEIHADMGMTSYGPNDLELSLNTFVDRADKAMYFAKKNQLDYVKEWDPSL